jgi:hypothetical protein
MDNALLLMLALATLTGITLYGATETAGPACRDTARHAPWCRRGAGSYPRVLLEFNADTGGISYQRRSGQQPVAPENLVRAMLTGRKRA